MNSNEIRQKFLNFFEKRGHKVLPSASLVPENDPSVLFNTAGMQPLVPYLLGQKHPMGTKLVNIQKCVRTGDIDEVGDNRHLTFFEMMGNWSLGDYFKEEAIKWSFEFLIDKIEGLGLEKERIYVTVFQGDQNAPRDEEAAKIWEKYLPKNRIYFLPAKNNWWSAGDNGPCGPDTEIFYDINEVALGDLNHDEFVQADDNGKVVEIWNNVFMEYEKKEGIVVGKLKQHNVDTGMGLERICMVCQKANTVFDTDLFVSILKQIKEVTSSKIDEIGARIISDHIKTSIMMISDGVLPSNKDQGYVLRRLIRRSIVKIREFRDFEILKQKESGSLFYEIILEIFNVYKNSGYLSKDFKEVFNIIFDEEIKFRQTLEKGLKEFEKGVDPFILFTTYGFPIELTKELAKEQDLVINMDDFNKKMEEHQKLSQTSSAGMFKGGLANHSEKTIKLHTAHHLLLAALKEIVGRDVKQKGSNITEERLRIDFICDHKLTDEEKQKVEEWVNDKIKRNLSVTRKEMPKEEAEKLGAEMEFGTKYPEMVSVYFIQDENGTMVSKEFCGGPHVKSTGTLGVFKIQKEEAVSQGVRRIKGVLI